jgi:hypothetical protein
VFEHPALLLKSRFFGVHTTSGVEQVHAEHSAGWAFRLPLPVKAVVGSDEGHEGILLGSPS